MGRRQFAAGQGAGGARARYPSGPAGQEAAAGRSNYDDAPKMGIDKVLGSGAVFCRPRVPNWVWASFGIARSASQARGILHEGIACACLG